MSSKSVEYDDNEHDIEDEEDDNSDDEGSLVDFIVKDEEDKVEEGPSNEFDGIDESNIVYGKRKRKPTQFYENEVFSSPEFRKMMLEDVPDSEIDAAIGDESEEDDEDEDEEDDSYEEEEDDDEEEGEEEEEEEEEEEDDEEEEK